MVRLKFARSRIIELMVKDIVERAGMSHIDSSRIFCFKSKGSTSSAVARIYELPRVWQLAFDIKPHYVIEAVSEEYNKLNDEEKEKVLIHELLHIPKTFSGALRPHKGYINKRKIERIHKTLRP